MASTRVIGLSPITFASEDSASLGKEYQIPLKALKVDAKGAIDASDWTKLYKNFGNADAAVLKKLLADLLKRGVISTSTS